MKIICNISCVKFFKSIFLHVTVCVHSLVMTGYFYFLLLIVCFLQYTYKTVGGFE